MAEPIHPPAALPAALPGVSSREFAHKLNNLLTVILADAETGLASGDPEDMRNSLRSVIATTGSIAELTRAFAKSSAVSASTTP